MAAIYEAQNLKKEALEIYKSVLKREPHNEEAKIAIRRLMGERKKFQGVDSEMRDFFIKMDTEIEFNEFERWLAKLWK